jgi:hypothetical protein
MAGHAAAEDDRGFGVCPFGVEDAVRKSAAEDKLTSIAIERDG